MSTESMSAAARAARHALGAAEVFREIEPEVLDRLATIGRWRVFAKGQFVFHQGDPAECLYVLVEGSVLVSVVSPRGNRMVVDLRRPRDVFGEVALLDGGERSATVETLTPSRVLSISRSDVDAVIREHPLVVDALFRVIGRLYRQVLDRTADFVFLDLQGRVAKQLVRHATRCGVPGAAGLTVDLGVTQGAFAEMVGGSRPMVNQILRGFVDRGLLTWRSRTVVIRDLDAIRRRADL